MKKHFKLTSFYFLFIFWKLDKTIPNFIWKNKHARLAKEILRENKSEEGRLTLPDVKTYHESRIMFKV